MGEKKTKFSFVILALASLFLNTIGFAQNQGGPVCVAPDLKTAISGSKISFFLTADDPDESACEFISDCSFDILENPDSETLAALNGSCSGNYTVMEFNWQTSINDTGIFHVAFSFQDICGGGGHCTTKIELFQDCIFAKIGEAYASPGGKAQLPIEIKSPQTDIGGFTYCIEYYPAILTFVSLERGEFFDVRDSTTGNYRWHYLVWRNNPSTAPHRFQLCIIGIGKLYYYEGTCLPKGGKGVIYLTFRLNNNEVYSCLWTPVIWKTLDTTCIFNAFADCSGNTIFLFNDTLFTNPNICDPGWPRAEIINCAQAINGRIIFKCDPQWIRGDINRNGFTYEMGDAVLFINYFIFGNEVFDVNPYFAALQRLSTDINGDGAILALSDLVALQRILSGDNYDFPLGQIRLPILPLFPNSINVLYNGRDANVTTPVDLGAIWLTFEGEAKNVTLLVPGLDMKWAVVDSQTNVIIYSFNRGGKIPAGVSNLLEISGDVRIERVEATEYMGTPVNVEFKNFLTIPQTFSLSQNYPNPFNHSTIIKYALPKDGKVSLKIYNVAGQLVREFTEYKSASFHSIFWDGTNTRGEKVSSGVYLYKLETENFIEVRKMTLLK